VTSLIDPNEPPAVPPKKSSPTALQIIAACVILIVASEAVQQTTCASHMHILGLALLQYTQDYDGLFPCGHADGSGRGWAGAIAPYVRAVAIRGVKHEGQDDATEAAWACPDDITGPDRGIDPAGLAVSYALNATLTADRNLPNCSTKCARLTSPQRTVMLFEVQGPIVQVDLPNEGGNIKPKSGWFSTVGNGMPNMLQMGGAAANLDAFGPVQYATGDIGSRGVDLKLTLPPRHSLSANYLAADGHVQLAAPGLVSSGNTPEAAGPQTGGLAAGTAASTGDLTASPKAQPRYSLTFSAM